MVNKIKVYYAFNTENIHAHNTIDYLNIRLFIWPPDTHKQITNLDILAYYTAPLYHVG